MHVAAAERKVAVPARSVARLVADLARYTFRTGLWWFPLVAVLLGVGAVVAATAKAAVPVAIYVLF